MSKATKGKTIKARFCPSSRFAGKEVTIIGIEGDVPRNVAETKVKTKEATGPYPQLLDFDHPLGLANQLGIPVSFPY